MAQLDDCQLEMVFSLVIEAENQRVLLVSVREYANLVVDPEELNCPLDVAHELVHDLVILALLFILAQIGVTFDQCDQKGTLWQLLSLFARAGQRSSQFL